MIQIVVIAVLAAICQGQDHLTITGSGSGSYMYTSGNGMSGAPGSFGYGGMYYMDSSTAMMSSMQVSAMYSVSGIVTSDGGFYGAGSMNMYAYGYTSTSGSTSDSTSGTTSTSSMNYLPICVSGQYSAGGLMIGGNMGYASMSTQGTYHLGAITIGSIPDTTQITQTVSSGFTIPNQCGSFTGYDSSSLNVYGNLYLGIGQGNFGIVSEPGSGITTTGTISMGTSGATTSNTFLIAGVSASAGTFSVQGAALGRPFQAQGTYASTVDASASSYTGYWYTNYITVTNNACDLMGSYSEGSYMYGLLDCHKTDASGYPVSGAYLQAMVSGGTIYNANLGSGVGTVSGSTLSQDGTISGSYFNLNFQQDAFTFSATGFVGDNIFIADSVYAACTTPTFDSSSTSSMSGMSGSVYAAVKACGQISDTSLYMSGLADNGDAFTLTGTSGPVDISGTSGNMISGYVQFGSYPSFAVSGSVYGNYAMITGSHSSYTSTSSMPATSDVLTGNGSFQGSGWISDGSSSTSFSGSGSFSGTASGTFTGTSDSTSTSTMSSSSSSYTQIYFNGYVNEISDLVVLSSASISAYTY